MANQLAPGKIQFTDGNGKPYAGGFVYFYIPSTTTFKNTWQDAAQTILNTNPIVLDGDGRAIIFGSGAYRQQLYDVNNNLIWDQLTYSPVGTSDLADTGVPGGAGLIGFDGGTLAQFFLNKTNRVVDSIASLRTLSKTTYTRSFVTGYYSPHDGGGGPYQYDPSDTTSADNGGSIIVAADGARWKLQTYSPVSVKQFGAKGDGTTDDTVSITNADAFARTVGAKVYFPAATYMVSQVTIFSQSYWYGDRLGSIIKSIIGSNKDVIYGNNSSANWGQSNPATYVNTYTLESLTIDGSWNNGTGNTLGGGIAVFGAGPVMRDIYIKNIPEHGLRTEYPPSGGAWNTTAAEGEFSNIKIDKCGKRGWWYNGPNDSVIKNVIVVDAGQSASNTWDGFYFDALAVGRCIGLHAWNRASSNRHQYGINIRPGASCEFVDCQFEGAYSGNVGLFSNNCRFDSSCTYFSAWNGVNFYMGLQASLNTIKGTLGAPGAGRPACVGIIMGSAGGDFIASNNIDVNCVAQEAANIQFTSFDGGANKIRMHCFNQTASTYTGTPSANDDIDIMFQNPGTGISHLKNRLQNTLLSVGSSASVTWTFPFPFTVSPSVNFSIQGPSTNADNGVWITSVSPTAVTIFNNNTATMTLDAVAIARD